MKSIHFIFRIRTSNAGGRTLEISLNTQSFHLITF